MSVAKKSPKLSRAEKAALNRKSLLKAAEKVVGEKGYNDAMITTITARAHLGAGTFYNYFESRQDLFDQLLPSVGRELLDFIKEKAEGAPTEVEREKRRVSAFFDFLVERPEFYRVLYEAELFAPAAFREHVDLIASGYSRVLRRARDTGELGDFTDEELEIVTFMLLGARYYLCMRYGRKDGRVVPVSQTVVDTYMKVIGRGLEISMGGSGIKQRNHLGRRGGTTLVQTNKTTASRSRR